ncbi:MAG: FAD-dependent oxidoreductase [Armatimonadota bacterium]
MQDPLHPSPLNNPNWEWYQGNVRCQISCPLGTDARGYVVAISEGRYWDAYRLARAKNPFATACARVCAAPCEDDCTRTSRDGAVTIRALKRFVCELFGPESDNDPRLSLAMSDARGTDTPTPNGNKVAIIGGGPAGLTCAHDLARLGYKCSVFEKEGVAGGQLALIPEFRLPRTILQSEIDAVLHWGIGLHLGESIDINSAPHNLLSRGYDAVVIATGLHIDTSQENSTWRFLDFVRRNGPTNVANRDVVVELTANDYPHGAASDAARTALRMGAKSVQFTEPPEVLEYQSLASLLHLAKQEGCGVLAACETGSEPIVMHAAQPVTPLVAHAPDSGVFTCGNLVIGARPFVYAIADGQRAAREVDQFITGVPLRRRTTQAITPIPIELYTMPVHWDQYQRLDPPHSPVLSGSPFHPTELSYEKRLAQEQGARCLRCHINPVFDEAQCNGCGDCVDICPEDALSLVREVGLPLDALALVVDALRCTRCGLCAKICPEQAITMQALEMVSEWIP